MGEQMAVERAVQKLRTSLKVSETLGSTMTLLPGAVADLRTVLAALADACRERDEARERARTLEGAIAKHKDAVQAYKNGEVDEGAVYFADGVLHDLLPVRSAAGLAPRATGGEGGG